MRAGSAWWYTAFWLARLFRPCGTPATRATTTISQIGLVGPSRSSSSPTTTWPTAPTTSLPRISGTPTADHRHRDPGREDRQQDQAGHRGGQPAALLEPLGVAVEQGVGGDRGEQGAGVGREQRPVAAQHPQVEERARRRAAPTPRRRPRRRRRSRAGTRGPARRWVRNSSSATSGAAEQRGSRRRSMRRARPARSRRSTGGPFGRRRAPSTRQASASGRLTAKVARQPPRPISRPPRVGPMTATVWVDTASTVSTLAGLSRPVRSASLRISDIADGIARAGAEPEDHPRQDEDPDRRRHRPEQPAEADQHGAGEEQAARAVEVDQPPDDGLADRGGEVEPGDQPGGLRRRARRGRARSGRARPR